MFIYEQHFVMCKFIYVIKELQEKYKVNEM